MSGFPLAWLALRAPYDLAARNPSVRQAAVAPLAKLPRAALVDLACGAGSTARALSSHIVPPQSWTLVDNDLSLLARALEGLPERAFARGMPVDLARDLELALDGPVDLVTTSALLDLVSQEWLERLATELAVRRLPLYAALSYDGRTELEPADPFDAAVVEAFNRHQLTDKGFGPALGPRAAACAEAQLRAVGYRVASGPSDWLFGPADREIQAQVLAGWAGAARELATVSAEALESWLRRRLEWVETGRAHMRIGHTDLYAAPE
ncbi:MAG: class I SAM-dependent methyltransferase [Variibacter sp.]|nr:class I SAM-dependent methyltransferase [Variibacter sp.]